MAKAPQQSKSEYGQQLAEKQGIKLEYGLRERQLRKYFDKGQTPGGIFSMLELRLDNIVFRAGLTPTRRAARQLVSHGHVLVNGRKSKIPSMHLRKNDIIKVRDISVQKGMFEDYNLRMKNFSAPSWLSVDTKKLEAKVLSVPDIKESAQPINIQTVIEFYSR